MATDSQGRPLSDDGQWAWNGTEWVPAATDAGFGNGPAATPAATSEPDAGATVIAPSPFAQGGPGASGAGGSGAPAPGQAPGYGAAPQQYGGPSAPAVPGAPGDAGGPGAPGYGGYPGGQSGFGAPASQQRSKKPIILAVLGVLIVVAVVLVLILVVFKGDDKSASSASPGGTYKCDVGGQSVPDDKKPTITFKDGGDYSLSGGGKAGKYAVSGSTVTFTGGSLDKDTAQYDSGANTVKLTYSGINLNCKG